MISARCGDRKNGAGNCRPIDGGKACWCTHVCFIHDSMRHSRRALLVEAPKNYLTRGSW